MLLSLHEWLVAQKIEAGAFKNNLAVCFCVLLWSVTLKHKSTMRIKSASSCLHSEWTVVVSYVISFPFFSVMHKWICDFSSTFVEMAGTPGLFKLVKQTTLKLVVVFDCKANLIVAPDSPQPPLQDACGCRWGQQEAPGAVDSRASVELRGSYTESDGEPKPTTNTVVACWEILSDTETKTLTSFYRSNNSCNHKKLHAFSFKKNEH